MLSSLSVMLFAGVLSLHHGVADTAPAAVSARQQASSDCSNFGQDAKTGAESDSGSSSEGGPAGAIEAKVVAYNTAGEEIPLSEVDESAYEGFIVSLWEKDAESTQVEAACDAGVLRNLGGGFYEVASLDVLNRYLDTDDVEYIEPNYKLYPIDDAACGDVTTAKDQDSPAACGDLQSVSGTDDASLVGNASFASDVLTVATASLVTQGYTPDDPLYASYQSNLALINVDGAWDLGIFGQDFRDGDEKTVVGVVDTGLVGTGSSEVEHEDIDYEHVLAGENFIDDAKDTTDTSDNVGHGTFCVGEIIAATDNGLGVASMAPEAYVRPYKMMDYDDDGNATGTDADFIQAINQAIKDGDVDVLSMSLGGENIDMSMERTCKKAVKAGILLIAAAGNYASDTACYPAAFDCVIGVSATSKTGVFASSYSNYGADNVFIAAPGTSLRGLGYTSAASYRTLSGTSMACPEVAALAALAKSIYPELSQDGFKDLLKKTSQDAGEEGYDVYYGWGIIDCEALVTQLLEEHSVKVDVSAVTGLTYTGGVQTGVAAGTGYTLASDDAFIDESGNATAIAAGVYTVTATLATGYVWSDEAGGGTDPVTLTFTIAQAGNYWATEPAIAGWAIGDEPSFPVGVAAFGSVSFAYYTDEACTEGIMPSADTAAGIYWMVASVEGTANYTGLDAIVSFEVTSGEIETVQVHRLYNQWSGEHLFTADTNEFEACVAAGWTPEDADGWMAPMSGDVPIYRLYNQWSGDHLYTYDAAEYEDLGSIGWNQEGVAFYSAKGITSSFAIYRLFNPWAKVGTHHFAITLEEYDSCIALGWQGEGVYFYGLSLGQ